MQEYVLFMFWNVSESHYCGPVSSQSVQNSPVDTAPQAKWEAVAFPLLSGRKGTLWLPRGLAGSTEGARICQWGSNEDAKVCLVVPFPQGSWMTTDYPTGSVQSPTPPRTDLRGTLFTEKKTDGGSSSSLMAGSIQSFVLLCWGVLMLCWGVFTKLLYLEEWYKWNNVSGCAGAAYRKRQRNPNTHACTALGTREVTPCGHGEASLKLSSVITASWGVLVKERLCGEGPPPRTRWWGSRSVVWWISSTQVMSLNETTQ